MFIHLFESMVCRIEGYGKYYVNTSIVILFNGEIKDKITFV